MKDKLTVLQNFIIPDEARYNHIKSELGISATAKVLGDCNWVVNYKTKSYFEEIFFLYSNHLNNLKFANHIEDKNFLWANVTLELLKEVKTPYVFYLTEDRMFHNTTKEEFSDIMTEVANNDIGFMCIGKIQKYGLVAHPPAVQSNKSIGAPPYMDNDDHIFTYLCKDTPYGCVSADSIFRVDVLKYALEKIIKSDARSWAGPWSQRPHVLEQMGQWMKDEMPDMLCAVPKKHVIVSDDDPGYELGK